MFNNGGNSAYTFKAYYSDGFSLDQYQLNRVLPSQSVGVDFSVDYDGHYVSTKFMRSDTGIDIQRGTGPLG